MHALLKLFIDYIFPPTCLSCNAFTHNSHSFCSQCWKQFNFISKPHCRICGRQFELSVFENLSCGKCIHRPPPYDLARSLLKFDEYSKKIIHAFKYQDKVELAKLFSQMLCKLYYNEINAVDYVIPVPMHRFKRLFRMYNQADLLCKQVARILDRPRFPDILIKTKWTKSQATLTRKERARNLKNSIILNPKYDVKGKTILLVDDVMTTSATVDYCSQVLKRAGAKAVIVLTAAMT